MQQLVALCVYEDDPTPAAHMHVDLSFDLSGRVVWVTDINRDMQYLITNHCTLKTVL